MSYHDNNNITTTLQSKTNAQGQLAPTGFHYMPDGTLMADSNMPVSAPKVIKSFNLDTSDIGAAGGRRKFTILCDKGAVFKLEVRDNATKYYYNFVTGVFQASVAYLEKEVNTSSHVGVIDFPAVTGSDDQYDVFLHAQPLTTRHARYNEVRFGDGSMDINSTTGSNSLLLTKVIYQYAALTLTIGGFSPSGTLSGTILTDAISVDSGQPKPKTAFSFTATASTTAAYRILKQPVSDDVLAFVEPVVGSTPINLPGENIYPDITTAADSTTDGGTTVNGTSTGTTVTTHVVSSTIATTGDRVLGNAALAATTVTVTAVSGGTGKTFTISEAITIEDDLPLTFSNQMNYSWPINNYANKLTEDMIVLPDTHVTDGTRIGSYQDIITLFEGTDSETKIIKNEALAVDTLSIKPTVVKGLVTVQVGNVVFNKQQVRALRETTLKIGGYGEVQILKLYGWAVKFTDLAITLTAPTTTTREATTGNAVIDVNSKEGVINNVSRVSGIGINPALQNPLITSGGGATGAGDWTMDAVQTLENGITLTVENTARVATITGNIQVIKAGTASQTLRFDVEKLLSTSA